MKATSSMTQIVITHAAIATQFVGVGGVVTLVVV